jgi:hypothetical protein
VILWDAQFLRHFIRDDEIVINFIAEGARSIVQKKVGALPGADFAGATGWNAKKSEMISEVWIFENEGDPDPGNMLAIQAFHEAMHNKLDTHPDSTFKDIHTELDGVARPQNISRKPRIREPSPANLKTMGLHLGLQIRQHSEHLLRQHMHKLPKPPPQP